MYKYGMYVCMYVRGLNVLGAKRPGPNSPLAKRPGPRSKKSGGEHCGTLQDCDTSCAAL